MKKITAILLIFLSLFCLSACRVGDIKVNFYAPYWAFWNFSKGSSFTYNASDIKKVDITWVGGEIEIVSSDSAELSVSENSEGLDDDAKMHYYIKDGKLTIHYSKALYREEIDTTKKHLRVEVPEGIEIDIDNINADISIGEMALGEIKLTNVSGGVKFSSLAANEIEIENVDGAVTANEFIADEVSAESVSGEINISKISANEINFKTVSGKTTFGVTKKSEVEFSGVSGNVEINIPDDIGATVEFSTMSGKFSSEKTHKTSNKTYTFGSGEIQIAIETMSGNLHIS
jgi:DUF4097 and DUF4098 domain-containing protein YvlB